MRRRTIEIGRLNKRITFLELSGDAVDRLGQITNGFTEIGTYWGDLYPIRGQEFYEVQKINAKVSHKCYVRYRASLAELDSNNYLRCEDETLSIEAVIDIDNEHKFLEIYCSKNINTDEIDDYTKDDPTVNTDPIPGGDPAEESDPGED